MMITIKGQKQFDQSCRNQFYISGRRVKKGARGLFPASAAAPLMAEI